MSIKHSDPAAAADAVPKLVQILTPLSPDERQRAISAVMSLFGQPISSLGESRKDSATDETPTTVDGIHGKASGWMRKTGVTQAQLEHVFSIEPDAIDVIAAKLPGKSKRQQTVQAYLVCGLKSFLRIGDATFADKDAREICTKVGCYDSANHSNYLKAFGNLIGGTKDAGWRLSNPGLAEAAKVVNELTEAGDA